MYGNALKCWYTCLCVFYLFNFPCLFYRRKECGMRISFRLFSLLIVVIFFIVACRSWLEYDLWSTLLQWNIYIIGWSICWLLLLCTLTILWRCILDALSDSYLNLYLVFVCVYVWAGVHRIQIDEEERQKHFFR